MEITRRNFIQFLVGGVAGLHITPIPWKLTDDLAIWTQNWPWVPVPPVGAFTHEASVCSLCPGGCGIEVRKVDDRAVKIEGRTDFPINPGGICPVGMGGLQLLYNESIRFKSPMKRVGPRGSGQFKDISWDEALTELSGRISALRKQGRPETVAAVDGTPLGSTMSLMIERLLGALGSPNYVRIPSSEETYRMATSLMQGTEGPMAYDLENADYILSFGSGFLEGWGAPGRVFNAWGLWHGNPAKKKTKIVQIESRASNTASKADQWVATRPGSEAALALGLAHVIIKDNLYDKEFVNDYSFGFHDWISADGKNHMGFKAMVLNRYSPAQVAEITGLSPQKIVSLAKDFATAKTPIAVSGKGKGALNGSLLEFMAVLGLNALKGNINKPGGVLVHEPLPLNPLPDFEKDAVAMQGLETARLDKAGTNQFPFAGSLINNLTEAIVDASDIVVDTLLVFSANPAYTLPDGGAFKKALKKVPFIVSFSPFRDETAESADLILPDHIYLEKRDDIVWPSGLQYPLYGLSRPVVSPVYKTRNTGDVIIKLAKGIGGSVGKSFPWSNFDAVLEARAKGLYTSRGGLVGFEGSKPVWELQKEGSNLRPDYKSFEEMWKKIESGGLWYRPVHSYKNWESLFKTPSGKFEFFSSKIELAVLEGFKPEQMGITATGDEAFMPHYEPPETHADRTVYPLLMIPYELVNLASGWIPNPPFLNKTLFDHQLLKNESFAEVNPKTAAEYNLKQGDAITIKSPKGEVRARVNIFDGAMPGIVYLPCGLGHTAYDEFLQGKGVNPNDIVHAGKDPLNGQPVWWNTPVKLVKV